MINATPKAGNDILTVTEKQLEAGLTPAVRADYDKIVVAGMKIALANGPNGFLGRLRGSKDPIGDVARGAVALIFIMRKESRGVMPMKAAIPAGVTLMLHGLDFVNRAKMAAVGEDQLVQATRVFTNTLFHRLGITAGQLQHAAAKVHAITQDPVAMQQINMKAGLVRHPDAPTPTPGLPVAPVPGV